MEFIGYLNLNRVVPIGALILAALGSAAPAFGDVWSRTSLGQGTFQIDDVGFPILDIYGDLVLSLPLHYQPGGRVTSGGLNVLRISSEDLVPPFEVDPNGNTVFGEYFRFDSLLLSEDVWAEHDPFTDWVEEVFSLSYVSCMDDSLLVSYWSGLYLCIDTLKDPNPTRLTLPIPAMKGTVAIDANGGVHVLSINDDYELWHHYYSDEVLVDVKLSDGPACEVVAVAGEEDSCHVAYTTFSEDLNLDEALDNGEDVNGNGVLDVVPHEVNYQLIDANVPNPVETLVAEALIRVCYLDLLFSPTHGLTLVYADSRSNAIRLAERDTSTWSMELVSSTAGSYGPVALAVNSNGDRVVSFVTQNGLRLSLAEETSGIWLESLIRETTVGAYFTGTDVVVAEGEEIVVLAAEKGKSYLAAYARSALSELFPMETKSVGIRSAFILTWPTPSEEVTEQILQFTSDLSDPDSWEDLERKSWRSWYDRVALETVVEQEAQKFYRVLELSE
jgi:hypothetical protein